MYICIRCSLYSFQINILSTFKFKQSNEMKNYQCILYFSFHYGYFCTYFFCRKPKSIIADSTFIYIYYVEVF